MDFPDGASWTIYIDSFKSKPNSSPQIPLINMRLSFLLLGKIGPNGVCQGHKAGHCHLATISYDVEVVGLGLGYLRV